MLGIPTECHSESLDSSKNESIRSDRASERVCRILSLVAIPQKWGESYLYLKIDDSIDDHTCQAEKILHIVFRQLYFQRADVLRSTRYTGQNEVQPVSGRDDVDFVGWIVAFYWVTRGEKIDRAPEIDFCKCVEESACLR